MQSRFEVLPNGKHRLQRATPNEFAAIIEHMSSAARIVSAVALQNGLIDKSIPANDALAELLNIGAVDIDKLETFDKRNVDNALKVLDRMSSSLQPTSEGVKLEAMIILLDSWRRKHEKVGDVKDTKLAKEYYAAVGEAQGKTFKHVFTRTTVSYFQMVILALEQISTTIKANPVNEIEFKNSLTTLINYFSHVENFSTSLSDFMNSLRQFDDLTQRDFVVDSPQRHFIDLLNNIEASKSSIVGSSPAAETEIARTANKVHTDFSDGASTDLFHLVEIVISQSHDGHKSLIYTSGLPNGYLDLGKLDGDVNNPAMKPLLGKFSPTDLQNGLAPLKTLTNDAIELHQAWSPLNKSESVSAGKQLVPLTRWFGAFKSPITSVTVTAAASFGGKPAPPVSFSSGFAKSLGESIKLRSTLLSVRHQAEVLQSSPFTGNLTLLSEMKAFLPNSTVIDDRDVPQLVQAFKNFKNGRNLFNALNGTKPMVEDISNDLVSVNITKTIEDISGGQAVLVQFVEHSDVGVVNSYFTDLENSGVKSVAETVQLIQQIRSHKKNPTLNQQLLKMSGVISSSIPKVKTLTNKTTTIVADNNPDTMKLMQLKILGKDSKNFGDSVMLVNYVPEYLEEEGVFYKFMSAAEAIDTHILQITDAVRRNTMQESWGDTGETNKTGKLHFADVKRRVNLMTIPPNISTFGNFQLVFAPFVGIQDFNLKGKSRRRILDLFKNETIYAAGVKMKLEDIHLMGHAFASSSTLGTVLQTLASLDQAFQFVAQQQVLVITTLATKSSTLTVGMLILQTLSPGMSSWNSQWIIYVVIVVFVIIIVAGILYWMHLKKKKKKGQKNRKSRSGSYSKLSDDEITEPLIKVESPGSNQSGDTNQISATVTEDMPPKKNSSQEPENPMNEPNEIRPFSNEVLKRLPQSTDKIIIAENAIAKTDRNTEKVRLVLINYWTENYESMKRDYEANETDWHFEKRLETCRDSSERNTNAGDGNIEQPQEVQRNEGGADMPLVTNMRYPRSQERMAAGEERPRAKSATGPKTRSDLHQTQRRRARSAKRGGNVQQRETIVLEKNAFFVPPAGILCPVSLEELIKLNIREVIRKLLSSGGFEGLYLNKSQLLTLLKLVQNIYMENRNALIDLPEGFYRVMGDIHGDFHSLLQHFHESGLPHRKKSIFLGDYVDRGRMSLEVMCLLFLLKIVYKDRVVLLRGNHELASVNQHYGFYDELMRRYGKVEGKELFLKFNEVFSWMPVAAVVGGKVFLVHGGISPSLESLDMIRNVRLPLVDFSDYPFLTDLVWSDPEGTGMYAPNQLRGISCLFGERAAITFLDSGNLLYIIRGHQVAQDGVMTFAGGKVFTVFSAPNYQNGNSGAAIYIHTNFEITGYVLVPEGHDNMNVPNVPGPPSTVN